MNLKLLLKNKNLLNNGILLSHKKEQNWVSWSDVDEPRACHTKWSKSEREKQVSYINTYVLNLEKWYWWTYLQDRNRGMDTDNSLVDIVGVRRGEGKLREKYWHIYAAAAAAKSLQSCLTLCYPIDGSPPGSAVPGILQARTLEWAAISFSNAWKWKVKVKLLSHVRLFATPWTAVHQAPPSMGFSREEYWSGVPLPSPTTCKTDS